MTHVRLLETLGQDLRYGIRLVRLNRGFAADAILSLALGIAANTSIFTLVDQVVLRLLPVERPRELVQLRMEGGRFGSQNGDGLHTFSYPLYVAFRDQNTVFSGVTGHYDRLPYVAGDRAEIVGVGWFGVWSTRAPAYSVCADVHGPKVRELSSRHAARS